MTALEQAIAADPKAMVWEWYWFRVGKIENEMTITTRFLAQCWEDACRAVGLVAGPDLYSFA